MLALLAFVVAKVDLAEVGRQLGRAYPLPLLAAAGLAYLAWIFNTVKWQHLLAQAGLRCRYWELYHLNLMSLFYALALPGQISGEVLKALRLGQEVQRRGVVLGSVMLDRVTGLAGLALIGCLGLVFGPAPAAAAWRLEVPLLASAGVLALSIAVLLAPVVVWPEAAGGRVPRGASGRAIGLIERAQRLVVARLGLRLSLPSIAGTVALGCVFQVCVVALNWSSARALGIEVSVLVIAWIMFAVSVLQVLPISIAGFGVREVTFVSLLGLYGVGGESALALAELSFGSQLLLGLTGWLIDVFQRRLSP